MLNPPGPGAVMNTVMAGAESPLPHCLGSSSIDTGLKVPLWSPKEQRGVINPANYLIKLREQR